MIRQPQEATIRRRRARRATCVAAGLALLFGASCAVKRPERTATSSTPPLAQPEPPAFDPLELERLYAALDLAEGKVQAGLELLLAGEEVAAEERLAEGQNLLRRTAERCAARPACDLPRFLDGFERLLGAHAIALKSQSYQFQNLEQSLAEEADREPGTAPYDDELPGTTAGTTLLRGTELREVIRLNAPLRAAIDDWLTWMRPLLVSSWINYQFLREEVAPIYSEAGLPEALLFAIMATETGGRVHSRSRAGAAGPLQFMRHTGGRYGLGVEDGFDQRYDPGAATRANVALLNDLFAQFDGSLEMALAAYNVGSGRMQGLRRLHGAHFWDPRIYYALPEETRDYVPRVLAAAWLFLHPQEFNLHFPVVDAARAQLTLQAEAALGELAICLGQERNAEGWFRTLRNLNPRLEPGDRLEPGSRITLPAFLVPVYEEHCLAGPLIETARQLHDANYPETPALIPYVVRTGDTLTRIAARFRCTTAGELAALNDLRPPGYVIRVGQELKVPDCG